MENYRKSAHCTYDIKYHLVLITKYPKPVITGKIALRTRELIRMICQSNEVEILAGHVGSDHIHLLVSVPPHLSASKLVQYIKGNTSRKLQMEYKELNRQFWGQHLWARGYFVASSGNVTDEIIKAYIQNQISRFPRLFLHECYDNRSIQSMSPIPSLPCRKTGLYNKHLRILYKFASLEVHCSL